VSTACFASPQKLELSPFVYLFCKSASDQLIGLDNRPFYDTILAMNSIAITQLKTNPSAVLKSADEYPIAVVRRGKTAGYVVGKDIFEKMIEYVENILDEDAIAKVDFKKKRDFEELAQELGI